MLDFEWLDYLRELNFVSLLVRYLLAILCGGAIGLEREQKHRPAGFRTHVLVCVGSVAVFTISQFLIKSGFDTDISRMAAQVISGIGFLGAGTIIVTRHQQIRGLTTAAGLWASACIGLALGAGFFEGAIVGCVMILIVNALLIKLSQRMARESRYVRIYIEFSEQKAVGSFIRFMRSGDNEITHMETEKLPGESMIIATVDMKYSKSGAHEKMIAEIEAIEGVQLVEEL